jgi:PAPA-1-like conserved region
VQTMSPTGSDVDPFASDLPSIPRVRRLGARAPPSNLPPRKVNERAAVQSNIQTSSDAEDDAVRTFSRPGRKRRKSAADERSNKLVEESPVKRPALIRRGGRRSVVDVSDDDADDLVLPKVSNAKTPSDRRVVTDKSFDNDSNDGRRTRRQQRRSTIGSEAGGAVHSTDKIEEDAPHRLAIRKCKFGFKPDESQPSKKPSEDDERNSRSKTSARAGIISDSDVEVGGDEQLDDEEGADNSSTSGSDDDDDDDDDGVDVDDEEDVVSSEDDGDKDAQEGESNLQDGESNEVSDDLERRPTSYLNGNSGKKGTLNEVACDEDSADGFDSDDSGMKKSQESVAGPRLTMRQRALQGEDIGTTLSKLSSPRKSKSRTTDEEMSKGEAMDIKRQQKARIRNLVHEKRNKERRAAMVDKVLRGVTSKRKKLSQVNEALAAEAGSRLNNKEARAGFVRYISGPKGSLVCVAPGDELPYVLSEPSKPVKYPSPCERDPKTGKRILPLGNVLGVK